MKARTAAPRSRVCSSVRGSASWGLSLAVLGALAAGCGGEGTSAPFSETILGTWRLQDTPADGRSLTFYEDGTYRYINGTVDHRANYTINGRILHIENNIIITPDTFQHWFPVKGVMKWWVDYGDSQSALNWERVP